MRPVHFTAAKEAVVAVPAGSSPDLRCQQGLARSRFGSKNNKLALAESSGPLVEFADVRVNL
jgi:hypothetical protein